MLKTTIKFAIRNISRQRLYSFINILGLSIGFCLFIIIGMYVRNEYNYDKFNEHYDEIYRMEMGGWSVMPPGITSMMHGQLPEIKNITRISSFNESLLSIVPEGSDVRKTAIVIKNGVAVDSSYFDIFSIKFISGNPKTALTKPMTCVLTETTAQQLFGEEDPLDKVILMDNKFNFKVTGVIEDNPNSHLITSFLVSITSLQQYWDWDDMLENTRGSEFLTFLQFTESHDPAILKTKIFNLLKNHERNTFFDEEDTEEWITLRPLSSIYFFKNAKYEIVSKHGDQGVVNAFIVIAIFILIIGTINFTNLTTARASIRNKEIGIKKVFGTTKLTLVSQFLIESIALSLLSMAIAITLIQIILPEFNNLALTTLSISVLYKPLGIFLILLITLFTGIISGVIPAFYLSKNNALKTLKGETIRGSNKGILRKFLIVFQFSVAAILIAGTIVVNLQVSFLKNKNLGFEKDHVLNIQLYGKLKNSFIDFKEKLLQNPNILNVSSSHGIPGNTNNTMTFAWNENVIQMRITSGDPDFLETLGIRLIEGRNFNWDQTTDQRKACLINETAKAMIGWEDPVGKTVNWNARPNEYHLSESFKIIGVIEDYHIESLHVPVVPLAIGWDPRRLNLGSIKISPDQTSKTLEYIETTWNEFAPEFPFNYTFLDQQFDQMYKSEERMQQIATYFSILAIFIACLGLFGLSAFMTERRYKEIGIRKVMGASIQQIIIRNSKEFSILVLISNIIAVPIGWYILSSWLENYPYRISIQWWVFLLAAVATFVISFLTVGFHSFKAAITNPVKAIRYE